MCINSLSLFVLFTYNKSQSFYIGHFNDSAGNVFSWRVFFFFSNCYLFENTVDLIAKQLKQFVLVLR